MFISIFTWMLANVPGFMRPGVNWLIKGVRQITGVIASIWNVLGMAVGGLFATVNGFRVHLLTFAGTAVNTLWWLRYVYIPRGLDSLWSLAWQAISYAIASARTEVLIWLDGLTRWASAMLTDLREMVSGLGRWALDQIAKVTATISALIRGLSHVLAGPDVLAEWILGALWKSALRRLYAERDRLFIWLFQGSAAFTVWMARVLEDMIVRLL